MDVELEILMLSEIWSSSNFILEVSNATSKTQIITEG